MHEKTGEPAQDQYGAPEIMGLGCDALAPKTNKE
jgi:hypothetical protein